MPPNQDSDYGAFVPGEGPMPCKYLILGEAPGAEEDAQGRPFVGKSGQLVTAALSSVGVSREDVFITNAFKCRPPNNRTPSVREIDEHDIYLSGEIANVRPEFILTLGAVPLYAATGYRGIRRRRGIWIEHQAWNCQVLPTYHPAYILRDPNQKEVWINDISKFFRDSD